MIWRRMSVADCSSVAPCRIHVQRLCLHLLWPVASKEATRRRKLHRITQSLTLRVLFEFSLCFFWCCWSCCMWIILYHVMLQVQYYSETKHKWMETTVIRIFELAGSTATGRYSCKNASWAESSTSNKAKKTTRFNKSKTNDIQWPRMATFAMTWNAKKMFLQTRRGQEPAVSWEE